MGSIRIEGRDVKVLVTAPDIRVRRALSGLLQSAGHRTVVTAHPAEIGPAADPEAVPDLVVVQFGRVIDARCVQAVEQLARLGCSVITVSSGRPHPTARIAATASACLDEDAPGFADQLTDAVRAVAEDRSRSRRRSRPAPRGTAGLRQRAPSDAVIPPMGRPGARLQTPSQPDPAPDVPGDTRQGP